MIGRDGMVARVDGFPGLPDGSLVVLQDEAGLLSTLVCSGSLVDSWRCRVISQHVATQPGVGACRRRVLYVPDACLTAVSSMNTDQIGELVRQQAREDFDAALKTLRRALKHAPVAEVTDEQLTRAGEQALVEHAQEQVATASALRDAKFRVVHVGGDVLRRDLVCMGAALRIEASPIPFGRWLLTSAGSVRGAIHCHEAVLPGEAPRGRVLLEVIRLWSAAFPDAPVPTGLEDGDVYVRRSGIAPSSA